MTLRRRHLVAIALTIAIGSVATPAHAEDPTLPLRDAVLNALKGSSARVAGFTADVEGLGRFESGGGRGMPPASTMKLYVGAAALLDWGPERTLDTRVVRTGILHADGTLDGDLVLVGGGDPSLRSPQLAGLAGAVAATGIRRVIGSIFADDTRFDRARAAGAWKQSYVPGQSGPLSALALDNNWWRRDPAFIDDPATAVGGRFREALGSFGVSVESPDRLGPSEQPVVASVAMHRSPPLRDLVLHMLKASDNFFAEILLKELGVTAGTGGYTDGGLAAVWRAAERLGIGPTQAGDGSGLSAHNRDTTTHQVDWLLRVAASPIGPVFRFSLATGCVDGTLNTRFCGTAAAGNVQAKTGSLPGVVTLAGYLTARSGQRVTFSFMLDGARNTTLARAAVDRAVKVLADHGP